MQLRGSGITLEKIMSQSDSQRKTNIICTMGPSCWDTDTLVSLIDQGMNVARLNFSHGDHKSHGETVQRLHEAKAQRPDKHVALMLDTKGPEIRTGFLQPDFKPLHLVRGQSLELITDYSVLGDNTKLAVSYKALPQSCHVGMTILAADGSLVMTVTEILETSVMVTLDCNATIGERKNMNLPGVKVDLPVLTEKDIADLVDFGLEHPIDMIALSFTQSAEDIEMCRKVLGERGSHIKIISKIENQEGLNNYDEILEATDGIMVARGDLGMEIPPEKVFLAQKMMIRKCNIIGKPVITATQMVESMCNNPRPTRAECTDVANAVLDGTDSVMLSGETAGGQYPLEAVTMMAHICREAESVIDYQSLYLAVRGSTISNMGHMVTSEAIASSAVKTALDMDAKMLVVLTESGNTARMVAKYRPKMPILVLTPSKHVAQQCFGLLRGTECRVVGSMMGTAGILIRAAKIGVKCGFFKPGETLVAIHGMM
jgi:pyruvate kinase